MDEILNFFMDLEETPEFSEPEPTIEFEPEPTIEFSVDLSQQQEEPPLGYPPVWNDNPNNQQSAAQNNYQPGNPNIVLVQPSRGIPTYAKRVAVIGERYCSPDPVDLIITRKVLHLSSGNFIVEDVNKNIMFKVKDGIQLLRDRRVLRDAEGRPIVTMQEKILTAHNRWNAFKGDNRDPCNGTEGICDFKLKGSWSDKSCVIYDGESNNIIAQMREKTTIGSMLIGKDKFMVTVYPNVDSAFIVALIVVLDAIIE